MRQDGRGFVLVREVSDGRRQRKRDVVVLDREQVGLARLQPALRGAALALGAMPVAAGVVGDQVGAAALAAQDCPPSAALRHCSMADITLSCPRLRWSCWAWRQAGPWVRKMSATSKAARPTPTPPRLPQSLQGADHLAQQLGGHVREVVVVSSLCPAVRGRSAGVSHQNQ